MPQLRMMQDPGAGLIVLGASMPPPGAAQRWAVSVRMEDHDRRGLGAGAWSVRRDAEHADIGHWMRTVYDAWFNGCPETVLPAAERALRLLHP